MTAEFSFQLIGIYTCDTEHESDGLGEDKAVAKAALIAAVDDYFAVCEAHL